MFLMYILSLTSSYATCTGAKTYSDSDTYNKGDHVTYNGECFELNVARIWQTRPEGPNVGPVSYWKKIDGTPNPIPPQPPIGEGSTTNGGSSNPSGTPSNINSDWEKTTNYTPNGGGSNVVPVPSGGGSNPDYVPTTGDAPALKGLNGGYRVGGYFAEWSIYGRDYFLADLSKNANGISDVYYSFVNIYEKDQSGIQEMIGKYQDPESQALFKDILQQMQTKNLSKVYVCDVLNRKESGNADGGDAWAVMGVTPKRSLLDKPLPWDAPMKGNFAEIKALKAQHPGLRCQVAVGGWTWSKFFGPMASTPELRQIFVKSLVNLYIKGNLPKTQDATGGKEAAKGVFDGVCIDWEFPGFKGMDYNISLPNDKQNHADLLKDIRETLNQEERAQGRNLYLGLAISADPNKAGLPEQYHKYVNYIDIMAYDYSGSWDKNIAPQANFLVSTNNSGSERSSLFATETIVTYLTQKCSVPKEKINVGVAFYGRGWLTQNGVAIGTPTGRYEAGINDYKEFSGFTIIHNVLKDQAWALKGGSTIDTATEVWTLDTPTTIATKASKVKELGLGGIFCWEFDGDDSNASLLKAMIDINKK